MPGRRKEKNREVPAPSLPPAPPKGKKGAASKTRIPRMKEPLRATRKVTY